MSLNYNLDEKIAKKQKILRALKKKYSLKKRQQRKIKLIKLGTLFSRVDLLEESQEKMVAYLEKYLLLDESKKKELLQIGSELLAEENESFYTLVKLREKRRELKVGFKMLKKLKGNSIGIIRIKPRRPIKEQPLKKLKVVESGRIIIKDEAEESRKRGRAYEFEL